ncbi:hypothetical protein [Afipia felis]
MGIKTSSAGFAICPCCRQTTDHPDPKRLIASIPLGGAKRRLVQALLNHFGEWIATERLADLTYIDDPNGGPMSYRFKISMMKKEANRQLAPMGLTIESACAAGYRLVWLKDDVPVGRGVS